jgi:hypothetical protein
VAVLTLPLRKFAALGVKIVHVAHLDLLDTLQCIPVERERRVNALSLLVVKAKRRVDWTRDHASLRERSGNSY